MSSETILIIEDDPTMLRGLKDNFAFKGFTVMTASDGEKGLDAALKDRPDLIVLDLMLPKVNGYEICRSVRDEGLDMPIIMLTAKGQEADIILGLNLGADDYVTKPFSIRELLARADAFLRRRRQQQTKIYQFKDFRLCPDARKLFRNDQPIDLTPKEFALLSYLLKNAGRALSRDRILSAVWGYDIIVTARSVDRCINTLRAKIEDDLENPQMIQTVREIGYRFEFPDDRDAII